ncbi:PilN domain-containing protein [Pedobacter hiemivivus]|uniref:Fimbrial assembly protein n=1 Tax=Pedobacter hiemivivus TaxID=2530454 RepID=A0A4R0NBY3_9SPHI|nr:PilN domain-containing protein [Pedobacter hiemivivus]TCC97715.1 hypothetical protein EZ444_07310 [Pedobacter hiemivivus]
MASLLGLHHGFNSCAGAEVHLKQDGSYDVRLLKLSLRKKLIQIDGKKRYSGTSAKITDFVLDEPLAVTLMGKGVLIKKTARLEVASAQTLQHLFPTLKLDEFYVQHFPAGAHSFVAIVRREIADAVMAVFKKQGAEVLMLSLGPFATDQVIPQLNSYGDTLKFDGHQVVLNEAKEWIDYSYAAGTNAGFPLKIDIETIPEEFLLAYAAAFQLILHDRLDVVEVEADAIKDRLIGLSAKLKFKQYGMAMVFFFFILLMLNFFLLTGYNSSNEELMSKAGRQSYIFENRAKLEQDVKEKEALVKKLGWNKSYKYAFLCDQIGASMPKDVTLDELHINPLIGSRIGLIKEAPLELGSMKIKGQTGSVYAINGWIYELKQKNWVKDVQLEKYTADDQRETQMFTILLKY